MYFPKFLVLFVAVGAIWSKPAFAQYHVTVPPPVRVPSYSYSPPGINPNGDAVMQGGAHAYELYQQQNQMRQWQEQQRRQWEYQQQQQQQWIRQQEAQRYMQEQQRYLRPHPNSTPMFYPPVSPEYQQQQEQSWQRQNSRRQQLLDLWDMIR